MKSIKIKFALPVGIALIAATASIVVGVLSYVSARDAVHEESFQKLQAVVAARKSEFERYLGMIQQDLRFQAENPAALSALKELDAGYNSLGSQAERLLQDAYITNNRFPPGEKHKLDAADDGSGYSTAHRKYHPFFRSFLTERSYYDIFLFDTAGNVVYTTFKELDFATNVQNGEWKDTGLGNVFRRAIAGRAGEIAFTDFAPYAPSANVPASFIATPLFVNGTVAGVLAFQMPIGKINEIMQQTEGMGETGETYIVGQDMLMRSDSRFSKESTILNQKVNTASVELALKGGSGVGVIDDYRGVPVLSAYVPVEFNGTNFAMIAEIDLSEAEAEAINIRNSVVIVTIATAIASILIGLLAARYLVGPISRLTSTMVAIARGDLSARIPHTDRGDEIGEMARTVEVFKRNAVEKERMTAEQKEQEQRAARDKRESSIALANQFESEVGSIVKSVASAAAAMQTSASSLSSIADATSSQATTVSAASEQASVNVGTVAEASQQLASAISEISEQVSNLNKTARNAATQAEQSTSKVTRLANASSKIGEVIALINDIAEQTNLLALNATIEAARAGEAGKGFAVVASEVKNLAAQTANATQEIGALIKAIQTETAESVGSIQEISGAINDINSVVANISAAVEEQSASTDEISRSVSEAASGTQNVSSTIIQVTSGADETGRAANEVLAGAKSLSDLAVGLETKVQDFLRQVRAP